MQNRLAWQVHESTARRLCQLAFITFGLLPLLVCLVWSARPFFPSYQRAQANRWEAVLSSQLGVQVTVTSFEARAPERFALRGIHLLHPETGAAIGQVALVEAQRTGGKWMIRLTHAELQAAELATAWKIVHEWFLCRPQRNSLAAQIGMNELTILGTAPGRALTDISMSMLPTPEATLVEVEFQHGAISQLSGIHQVQSESSRAHLIVKRHHALDEPMTEVRLRTGDTSLPCSLIAGILPQVERLGSKAHFSGMLNLDLNGNGWRAQIANGEFTQVDLAHLTQRSAASISGIGGISLKLLTVSHQGLEFAHGRGEFRSGQMASGLFHSLGQHLGVGLRNTNPVSSYGFDRLELAVDIRQPHLHLAGFVVDSQGALAARGNEKWEEAIPLERLVDALAACSSAESPRNDGAAVSSSWLAKQALVWLPLGEEQTQTALRNLRLSQTR